MLRMDPTLPERLGNNDPTLTCIKLNVRGWRRYNYADITKLIQALATNTCLTTLVLAGNQIGDEGAKALARALVTNTCLATLDLAGNLIGDEGAEALARVLVTNTCLTTLDLADNLISDKGAKALGRALASPGVHLSTLIINNNRIGDEGMEALVATSLSTLCVCCNRISDEGAKALEKALASNTNLTFLSLSGNWISKEEGAKALQRALATNAYLTDFNYQIVPINMNLVTQIECKLIHNREQQNKRKDDFMRFFIIAAKARLNKDGTIFANLPMDILMSIISSLKKADIGKTPQQSRGFVQFVFEHIQQIIDLISKKQGIKFIEHSNGNRVAFKFFQPERRLEITPVEEETNNKITAVFKPHGA